MIKQAIYTVANIDRGVPFDQRIASVISSVF